jgi:hypothetical protein
VANETVLPGCMAAAAGEAPFQPQSLAAATTTTSTPPEVETDSPLYDIHDDCES